MLLGIARQTDQGVEMRVHPCMIPLSVPIARVDGVFNAVVAEGPVNGGGKTVQLRSGGGSIHLKKR